mgnify:CR=1 FL=1
MSPTIKFLGAVGTVTGSRFIVQGSAAKVMIDCGLYQGLKELRLKNWEVFPEDPKALMPSLFLTRIWIIVAIFQN